MWAWPVTTIEQKSARLSELIEIGAKAGVVVVHFPLSENGFTIEIPSDAIGEVVLRLEAARDAAALMASQK